MSRAIFQVKAVERLRDKVAFISGSGAGIGRAAALLFAREGAMVAVADVNETAGRETLRLLTEDGGQGIYVKTDVTSEESVRQAVRIAADELGKMDTLYCNVGGSLLEDGPVAEVSVEVWDKTYRTNLLGTFLCCRYGIPELIRNGGGSVILTVSMAGLTGWNKSAYTAAKGAIISLTRLMAVDYAGHRIRVNCLCPGFTRTERTERDLKQYPQIAEQLGPLHLLGFGEARDVAYAALYLASDESKIVTGVVLPVDSGYTVVGRRVV